MKNQKRIEQILMLKIIGMMKLDYGMLLFVIKNPRKRGSASIVPLSTNMLTHPLYYFGR